MSKYNFRINHIDETGEKVVYEFRAASMTNDQMEERGQAEEDGEKLAVFNAAFHGCKADGEEVDNYGSLPQEVLVAALARHPSFQDVDAHRPRRRRR